MVIQPGQNLTIDLNGKTIDANTEIPFVVKEGAQLNIKNGTIDSETDAIKVEGNNVTVNIESDATVKSETDCCVWIPTAVDNLVLNISGTLISKSTGFATVSTNGTDSDNVEINITGGTIISENSTAVFFPANGTLNISGGEIKGKDSAVEFRGNGTLNISGGTFTTTADTYSQITNGNGTTTKGAAVAVVPHADRTSNVNITGGEFIATTPSVCYAYYIGTKDASDNPLTTGTIGSVSITNATTVGLTKGN